MVSRRQKFICLGHMREEMRIAIDNRVPIDIIEKGQIRNMIEALNLIQRVDL